MRGVCLTVLLLMSIFLSFFWVNHPAEALKECTICHGKPDFKKTLASGRVISLYVDPKMLANSVHAKRTCLDCHVDITEIPHSEHTKKVNCTQCHYLGNPVGAPQTERYRQYKESVHGKAAAAGNEEAPICQDCHGDHNVIKYTNPNSKLYKLNIPKTCGRCHLDIYSAFKESVHGQAIEANNMDAPVCTDCHREHTILAPENPKSSVFPTNIPKTCSKCHAAETLMEKYGIKAEQVESYAESFHGIASEFGLKKVANCSSCHGVHDIRAPNDPKSTVNIANIPKTCGKCHPGANVNYAKGKIHVQPRKKESGAVFYVSSFFKWLTITVMLGLGAYIVLDLFRRYRSRVNSQ